MPGSSPIISSGIDVSEPVKRALGLIGKDIPLLAVELARAEQKYIPAATALDERAHAKRIEQSIRALLGAVQSGKFSSAVSTLRVNMQLSMPAGLEREDFIHIGFIYLSVLRRWVLRHAPDALRALNDWDELENVLLPFLGEFVRITEKIEEPTIPGANNPFLPSSRETTQD